MPVASTPTIVLDGAVGHLVDVQVDVSAGQATLTLVGRTDQSITSSASSRSPAGSGPSPACCR